MKKKFGANFIFADKVDVNGSLELPLYRYIKSKKKWKAGIIWLKRIRWNFEKFLISPQGKVIARLSPWDSPLDFEKYLK